jgi:hypothetical protein
MNLAGSSLRGGSPPSNNTEAEGSVATASSLVGVLMRVLLAGIMKGEEGLSAREARHGTDTSK